MGFSASGIKLLGVLEVVCFILFVIPRTGVLGTLLLAAYMGDAIATHRASNSCYTAHYRFVLRMDNCCNQVSGIEQKAFG